MNTNSRLPRILTIRSALLSEVGIGISVNSILLILTLKLLLQRRPKPTDLLISHLALVHIVMLSTMAYMITGILGSFHIWNDFSCKSVLFLNRLMRSLSICTTCLQSILQAIILSPQSSCLAKFKLKSSQLCVYCLSSLWVLNLCLNSPYLLSIALNFNFTSDRLVFLAECCSLWSTTYLFGKVFFILTTFQDAVFIGVMSASSGYMGILLCRHRKVSQYLHSTSPCVKSSTERRATLIILLLMGFFVVMYIIDCIICFLLTVRTNDPVCLYVQILVSSGYATVSPFILLSSKKQLTMQKR